MANIYEGKTTNEAIEKGLKDLKASRKDVDIKVLETEEKRSFFSILTPRVVKVEITLRENSKNSLVKKDRENVSESSLNYASGRIRNFLNEFISLLPTNNLHFDININNNDILVDINGDDTGYLIGYRGNVLNSIQVLMSNIANMGCDERVRILLNIGGYKEKRAKDLRELADKIAGSVIRNKKSITLEPMSSYERKIIHARLQENSKVKTHSVGEEPNRKIVVSLNR